MELFEFCMEIIKREGERFNVSVNTSTASLLTAANAGDVNYDIAHNRCAFLYRRGAINLYFAKDCFRKFLSDYKSLVFLLSKWINTPNLTLCTITKGPALDYISLLLAYQESGTFPSLFKNVKVVTKYGAWRNTTNIIQEIVSEGYLKSLPPSVSIGNIEVIQGDPFKDFTQKVKTPISDSDVVMMMKVLNLQADGHNQKQISKSLQEILGTLKPGAILFCIDTKPSIAVATQLLSTFPGKFLFQPTFMNTMINLEYADFYKNIFGCSPVVSARGSFFVWQKSAVSPSNSEHLMDEVSESVKRLLKINNTPSNDICSNVDAGKYSTELLSDETSPSGNFVWKFDAKNSVGLKSNDQQSVDSVAAQNSKYCLSTSSLQNGLPAASDAKKETKNIGVASSKSSLINECIQTDPEKNLKGTEPSKIAQLTNRIADLTKEISALLEFRALTEQTEDNCFKNSEETCKHSAANDSVHVCSSVVSCSHKCSCSDLLPCTQNYCKMCCQKNCLTCDKYNSSASLNECEASKYCSSSCITRSKCSGEYNSPSGPQLIIPLNTLSTDVASQIISLLTQPNQEL